MDRTDVIDQLFTDRRPGRPRRRRTPIGMVHGRHVVMGSGLTTRSGPESSSRLEPG
jgi:hypothetical protein